MHQTQRHTPALPLRSTITTLPFSFLRCFQTVFLYTWTTDAVLWLKSFENPSILKRYKKIISLSTWFPCHYIPLCQPTFALPHYHSEMMWINYNSSEHQNNVWVPREDVTEPGAPANLAIQCICWEFAGLMRLDPWSVLRLSISQHYHCYEALLHRSTLKATKIVNLNPSSREHCDMQR